MVFSFKKNVEKRSKNAAKKRKGAGIPAPFQLNYQMYEIRIFLYWGFGAIFQIPQFLKS
jgi:hypothetical protein